MKNLLLLSSNMKMIYEIDLSRIALSFSQLIILSRLGLSTGIQQTYIAWNELLYNYTN